MALIDHNQRSEMLRELICCPRCGYDVTVLRPPVWANLEGTCPECGYVLNWTKIDTQSDLPWFIESRAGEAGLWKRWWKTLMRVARIQPFFKDVKLEGPVSLKRAVLWAAMLFVFVQVVFGTHMLVMQLAGTGLRPMVPPISTWTVKQFEEYGTWMLSGYLEPIVDVSVYYPNRWRSGLDWSDWWSHNGGVSTVVLSLGSALEFNISAGGGLWSYPLLMLWGLVVSTPLFLMILPWTRKRAKVRTAHVVRATVYSMAVFVPLVCTRMVIEFMSFIQGRYQLAMPGGMSGFTRESVSWMTLVVVVSQVWLWMWWKSVFEKHWALAQPRAVWVSMIVVQCLLMVILLSLRVTHWMPMSWIK